MKRTIILLAIALILLPFAGTAIASDAEIRFVNQSTVYVRFYVDDIPSGACQPGEYAFTTASVGNHTLKAIAPQGQTLIHSIYLGPEGFVWTITGSPNP